MGLLVDQVNQVIELDPSAIGAVPPFGVHVRLDFIRGMAAVGDKFVMILDVDRVLEASDLRAAAAEVEPPTLAMARAPDAAAAHVDAGGA